MNNVEKLLGKLNLLGKIEKIWSYLQSYNNKREVNRKTNKKVLEIYILISLFIFKF